MYPNIARNTARTALKQTLTFVELLFVYLQEKASLLGLLISIELFRLYLNNRFNIVTRHRQTNTAMRPVYLLCLTIVFPNQVIMVGSIFSTSDNTLTLLDEEIES